MSLKDINDKRSDKLFELFLKFCLVIIFILMTGMGFLTWMILKE